MKHLKRMRVLLVLALCLSMFVAGGVVTASAGDAESSNLYESYSFGDLPYHTGYSEFGYYEAGYTSYTLKAGLFDVNAENYNLKAFDTWSDDKNAVSLSTITGFEARNWRWDFARNTSVVLEMKSKVEGTIQFDFSACGLGGWLDGWPSVFGLYLYDVESGAVTTLARNFQNADAAPLANATYNHTVNVTAGDIVYFEIGISESDNAYTIQNLHNAKVIVTPTAVNNVVAGAYAGKLDAKVGGLVEANYAPSDWAEIKKIVSDFRAGSYASTEALIQAYNGAVAAIDAITPDPLKDKRTQLINQMNAYVGGLTQGNYTSDGWAVIAGARDAFVAGAADCESEDALQSLFDEKMGEITAVKAYKQGFTYLDYPSKMNANGYNWIEGEIFSTKLYAGTAENLKEFDAQGSSENIMYNTEFNAGYDDPAWYVENWKWYISNNMGVVTVYKAHADLKLTITNTYIAEGHATNGWTEDCTLTYYIVRGENVKDILTVNAPASDADWSGTFYLKAGDMLYVEFNSTVINVGETRNTEAPCGLKAEADSTAFNEELYAEQNNDLSKEVEDEIASKKAELESYYAGLTESDYSATNWLTLAQYIEQFAEKCEDEVETVEDVVAIYQAIRAEMEAVPTIAEAQAELQNTLNGYVAELQAEYDALVANNHYTDENKSALDKAFEDGKANILASKSKTAGNQEKIKAIAAIKAIQASEAPKGEAEKESCFSSLAGTMVMPLMAIACAIIIKKRKED